MTIASLSVSPTDYQTASDPVIGMAVLAKSLSTAEQSGLDMIKMMEQSLNPNLGMNIDLKI